MADFRCPLLVTTLAVGRLLSDENVTLRLEKFAHGWQKPHTYDMIEFTWGWLDHSYDPSHGQLAGHCHSDSYVGSVLEKGPKNKYIYNFTLYIYNI